MKKLIAWMLALVMVFGLMACAAAPAETTSTDTAAETESAATEEPAAAEDAQPTEEQTAAAVDMVIKNLSADGLGGYKIGMYYLPNVEGYGKPMFDYFDYLCELTNCEPLHYEMTAWSSADIMAAVETLVSQGADAIICILGNSPAMFEYLNDNGVYYTLMTRSYSSEVCDVVMNSEYFCGFIGDLGGENGIEFQKGYGVAKVLAEQGCKKIAIVAASEGETMNDERVAGHQAAADEFGMEVLAVYRGADYATGTSDILASYGTELDGICTCSTDSSLAALLSADMVGKIKLVSIDAPSEPVEFLDAGYCSAFTSEGAGFLAIMYMQMFNALTGADRLFTEDQIVPQFPGIVISDSETYNKFLEAITLVNGGFTPDEILSLNSIIDPGMTVAEREEMLRGYCTSEYWNIPSICARVEAYTAAQ